MLHIQELVVPQASPALSNKKKQKNETKRCTFSKDTVTV